MLYQVLKPMLKCLPDALVYRLTSYFVGLPQRIKLKDSQVLNLAQKIYYGHDNTKTAWCWGQKGPLVVCVHGWGGCGGADFAALAQPMANDGFRVVAIDMTAHGSSSGERLSFKQFSQDIEELSQKLNEPIFSYVAFSAGGLSMMAARKLKGITADNYVCIASPVRPYPPLALISRKLAVSKNVLDRHKNDFSNEFECDWQNITKMAYGYEENKNLLLIYDQDDRLVSHEDGDIIHALWPTSQLIKLCGHSHKNLIHSQKMIEAVIEYLNTRASEMQFK